jgi:hypothetical protein
MNIIVLATVMGKRKALSPKVQISSKKKSSQVTPPKSITQPKKVAMVDFMDTTGAVSPTSKITLFKLDVFQCNGKQLRTELGAADLESIWTNSLLRDLRELSGYTSSKTKNDSEIRIQYQLKKPMSIRSIAFEAEFNHERSGPQGIENLRCRVVGLNNIRAVEIGEKVRLTLLVPNFDIIPEQLIEWMSKFARIHEGHR